MYAGSVRSSSFAYRAIDSQRDCVRTPRSHTSHRLIEKIFILSRSGREPALFKCKPDEPSRSLRGC